MRIHHAAVLITRSYAVPVAVAGPVAEGPRGRVRNRVGETARAAGRAASSQSGLQIVATAGNGSARSEFSLSEARRFEWHHRVRNAAMIASASVRVPV